MGRRARLKTIAFLLSTVALTSCSYAAVMDAFWLGGSGSWNDPTKWSGGVVPNNNATDTFRVTIPSGSVIGLSSTTIDSFELGAAATLTCGDATAFKISGPTRIDGQMNVSFGRVTLGPDGLLTGNGILSIKRQFGPQAILEASSGVLTIDTNMTVMMESDYGRIGTISQPLVNKGHIVIKGFRESTTPTSSIMSLTGSSISNMGLIEAQDIVGINVPCSPADLGNLTGSFQIRNTLLNVGQTLSLDGARWYMGGAGKIQDGNIETPNGGELRIAYLHQGSLDGATLNGRVYLAPASKLYLLNGALTGHGEIAIAEDSTGPEGPGRLCSSDTGGGSLTIGAEMLVHGSGGFPPAGLGYGPGVGDWQNPLSVLNNHGTLRADAPSFSPGEFSISANSSINDGVLQILRSSFIYTTGNMSFASGGALDIELSAIADRGLLRVNDFLDLTTAGDRLELIAGAGVVPFTFYRIATTGSGVIGQFDFVTPGFEVMYTSSEIFARAVPEPGMLALPAIGAFLAYRSRRRMNVEK